MAKNWKQILDECGKVPPEQTMADEAEMLKELGMTRAQFTATEEYMKTAQEMAEKRFTTPTPYNVVKK